MSLRGRLLVATPGLVDLNFAHTVVLLLEHSEEEGALGVVLNRPSPVTLAEAIPDWASVASHPPVVFIGGPVQRQAIVALARGVLDPDAFQPVLDTVGVVDLGRDPDTVGVVEDLRVFSGYAGWAPGQLEQELELGGWWVVDSHPDDPFDADPERLWGRAVRRQGGVYRHFPDDVRAN